jgi:putative endopeptidase
MPKQYRAVLTAALLALALTRYSAPPEQGSKARYGAWGVALGARDTSARPGDDFFRYANGRWFDETDIPPEGSRASVDDVLRDEIELQLRGLIEAASTSGERSDRQLADFWASWMDEAGIEARGTKALAPYLDRIAAIRTREELLRLFTEPGHAAVSADPHVSPGVPLRIEVIPDARDPTRYVGSAEQSGLGMPGRDYYLEADHGAIRKAYRDYVARLLSLAGLASAAARADAIVSLETALATSHWPPERSRDVAQAYNPMNRRQLETLAPEFEWTALLARLGLGEVDTIVAVQTTAIADAAKLLATTPLQTWKDYAAYHFIRLHAEYLPKAFDQAHFAFHETTLRGVPRQRERWKRGVEVMNALFGEAVGKLYVERYYPVENTQQLNELIADIRASFSERIETLDWMDEETRAEALTKLDSFEARVGHPARYIDYSAIEVRRSDILGNVVRANDFDWKLRISRLGAPVDRALWHLTPQELDAQNHPLLNQITFPAAILQPPFFDRHADPAVNYGAIGAVIGHEFGHGFDDQGRHYDAKGRIRDWWSAQAAALFEARSARLGAQFDQYEVLPGARINGQLTMGENIGDLGGLEMAYAAYRRYVNRTSEPPVLDGLSGDQRFFLSYAQSWRWKMRPDRLREYVLTNPHSPPEFRVNGIVRNVDGWYKAFNVKPGDKLYLSPEQRVRIW